MRDANTENVAHCVLRSWQRAPPIGNHSRKHVAEWRVLFLDLPDLSAADGEKTQSRSRRAIGESEKPVAKLIPAADGLIDLFGYMAGTIQIVGDIVGPLDVEWTGDGENL